MGSENLESEFGERPDKPQSPLASIIENLLKNNANLKETIKEAIKP